MSESTHTPGPWEWVKDLNRDGYCGLVGDDGKQEVLFPDTANDGDTGAAWFDEFPSDADARLIAAAPELLAELRELQITVRRVRANIMHEMTISKASADRWEGVPWLLQERIGKADAAINKAKGECDE